MSSITVVQAMPSPGEQVVIDPMIAYLKEHEGFKDDSALIVSLKERAAFGLAKYHQPLMTRDGRNTDTEIIQELGDTMFYAYKGILESGDMVYRFVFRSAMSLMITMLAKEINNGTAA